MAVFSSAVSSGRERKKRRGNREKKEGIELKKRTKNREEEEEKE